MQEEEAVSGYPIRTDAPEVSTIEYVDKKTGQVRNVPEGIDPGWDYNPGKSPWPDEEQ